MAVLLVLGFSSGMPLYLTSTTLQTWLRVDGVDLTTIGLFSLVGLPYSVKFLWAPLLDRFRPPLPEIRIWGGWGRRRGWMVVAQILLMGTFVLIASSDPGNAVRYVAVLAIAAAFWSASQDIVIDAYRADVLSPPERGAGVAVNVLGYRIAMIVTGSVALVLADSIGWPTAYLVMAALMIPGMLAASAGPEPEDPGAPPATIEDAVVRPFAEFYRRLGAGGALVALGFIAVYKLGDNLAGIMTTPFLLDTGFSQSVIGVVRGGFGIGATIVGLVVGGAWLSRLGTWRSLWLFGLLQAGTNFAYYGLAVLDQPSMAAMVGAVLLEYFAQGLGTAALISFLMGLCNTSFSATQYALLSSFIALNRDIGAAPAGWLAEATGYPRFFLITVVLAVPGLVLLRRLDDRSAHPPGSVSI
jgi:PAT family beta-lactamase induction signal transducer AmpG